MRVRAALLRDSREPRHACARGPGQRAECHCLSCLRPGKGRPGQREAEDCRAVARHTSRKTTLAIPASPEVVPTSSRTVVQELLKSGPDPHIRLKFDRFLTTQAMFARSGPKLVKQIWFYLNLANIWRHSSKLIQFGRESGEFGQTNANISPKMAPSYFGPSFGSPSNLCTWQLWGKFGAYRDDFLGRVASTCSATSLQRVRHVAR